MNRQQIETVKKLCAEVSRACDDALKQLDAEVEAWNVHFSEGRKKTPSDHSYRSKQTAALRRKSMDLTRALADLRRPS